MVDVTYTASGLPLNILVKIAQTRVEHELELTKLFLKNIPEYYGEAEVRDLLGNNEKVPKRIFPANKRR